MYREKEFSFIISRIRKGRVMNVILKFKDLRDFEQCMWAKNKVNLIFCIIIRGAL